MCGIAGYFGTRELSTERLQSCLALMRRRGPDDSGLRCAVATSGRRVYLLNTRLRIVDLDPRASQPFNVRSRWMTYNGEIYNYVELRDQLAAAGRRFSTTSDTEVLLTAIDEYGPDVWNRCEGMWAAAIFDGSSGRLTLSRDRFGEKPLYLYEDSSGIYFGSEPKCIAALLGHPLTPNREHVRRLLVNGYKSLYKTGDTFFEGLTEVAPGTCVEIDAEGTRSSQRYWQPDWRPTDEMSYEDAVAGVRTRLIRSVELRLRADVPIAFCMSGGVDSNALIAIAARQCGYDVHGFTIVDDDPRYDEREAAVAAAAELGVRHTQVPTDTHAFLDRLRDLVVYHDAPVYTIAYFAHATLMEHIAADGYRVAVSGTAADEILSGYYDHHLAYLYEVRNDPDRFAAARDAWSRDVEPFVRNPHLSRPDLFLDDPGFRDHLYFDAERYAGYLVEPWHEAFREERYADGLLRNRMVNELFHENVPVILHEDDSNAMRWSVENRSPYLDRSLVEFCGTIPTRHLVRDGLAKAPLRDAVRGIAPDAVIDNPRKVGFNAPILSFLDVDDPAVRDAVLADGPIFDLVQRERIAALLDRRDLPNSDSKFLFSFVSCRLFLEQFS